jgi:DNA-binding NarL/FixJ family response regulator
MTQPIRVLLADDHPLFREGVRMMLSDDPDIEVVGQAGCGGDAIRMALELRPDILLCDVSMPDIEGPEVVEACMKSGLKCRYILLTMHRYPELLRRSVALGVQGYVVKDGGADEVVAAVRSVAKGEEFFSPSVAGFLQKQAGTKSHLQDDEGGIGSLTSAQRKVLRLVATDRTSKEIADELGLSVRTIENHRANICRKLGLHGTHSLVKFAFDHQNEL